MLIRPPDASDWQAFYRMADDEGWRVPLLERGLFLGPWFDHAYALADDCLLCGLVTAVAHQRSGWIGNLIVPKGLRGRGYGSRLFSAALSGLDGQGLQTLWLTASEQGRPLYEKADFTTVDRVERWVSRSPHTASLTAGGVQEDVGLLAAADQIAWGEDRSVLLSRVALGGQVLAYGESVALLQGGRDLQLLGPWYSNERCLGDDWTLLQYVLAAADPSVEIVVDLLGSSPVRDLLAEAGFICTGQNELMVRGAYQSVDLHKLASLASLGSVG